MKAIIHIGMPKTGSTTIQTWLNINRVALEAGGVITFGNYRWHAIKHAVFQYALQEMGVDEQIAWVGPSKMSSGDERIVYENWKYLTRKFDEISKISGIFTYSYDMLYRCTAIQMEALDSFLSRYFEDITYVVYIRNTIDFFVSWYSQKLQNGPLYNYFTREYFEFLNECAADLEPFGRECSFGNLFEWKKMVGNRLNVRLLESDWLVNEDLIEDFASLFCSPTFGKIGRMNESFAAEYIEYVRFLNREFRDSIPRKLRAKALAILRNESSGKPKLTASDAQANSFREIHREQEEKIRRVFFPDRPFLFSPKFRGSGIAPVPLTSRRKAEIESKIQENMAPEFWAPHKFARNSESS